MGAGDGLTPWPQSTDKFVEWCNGLLGKLKRQVIRGYGIAVHRDSGGQALSLIGAKPFFGKLAGAVGTGGNPYTVLAEVMLDSATETWSDIPGTGGQTAIELNSRTGCGGRIVWLMPGVSGDYRFYDPLQPPCQLNIVWDDCTGDGAPSSAVCAGASVTVYNDDGSVFGTCVSQAAPPPPSTVSTENVSGQVTNSKTQCLCVFKNVPPGDYYALITEPNYGDFMKLAPGFTYVPEITRFTISTTDKVKNVIYRATMLADFVCCVSGATLGPTTTTPPATTAPRSFCGPVKKNLQLSDSNGTNPLVSVILPTYVSGGVTIRDQFKGGWSTSYPLTKDGGIFTTGYGYTGGVCYNQAALTGAVGYVLLCPSQDLTAYYPGPVKPYQWNLLMYWGACFVESSAATGSAQTILSVNPWGPASLVPPGQMWDGNTDVYNLDNKLYPTNRGFFTPIQVDLHSPDHGTYFSLWANPIPAVSPCYPLALAFTFPDFSYQNTSGTITSITPPGGNSVTIIQAP